MSSVLFLPPLRPFFLLPMSYLSMLCLSMPLAVGRGRKASWVYVNQTEEMRFIYINSRKEGRKGGRKEGKNS